MKLELWFDTANVELTKIVFHRDGQRPRVSFRGKGALGLNEDGSFQWTAAVRAFALLCVETELKRKLDTEQPSLSGRGKSAAASLDYAISKPTLWIEEIFGVDHEQKPVARRVFRRENSEQKSTGPVRVALAPSFFEDQALVIRDNSNELIDRVETLLDLKQGLERFFEPPARPNVTSKTASQTSAWNQRSDIVEMFMRDAMYGLSETELMNPVGQRELVERLKSESEVTSSLQTLIQKLISHPSKKGCDDLEAAKKCLLSRKTPLKVAIPPTSVPRLLLFLHLQEHFGLKVDLDLSQESSSAFVDEKYLGNSGVDLAVLTVHASVKLAESSLRSTVNPLMLLPRTAMDLVYADSSLSENELIAYRASDPYTAPRIYLKRALEFDEFKDKTFSEQDASIAEIVYALRKSNVVGFLAFPFSAISALYYDRKVYSPYNEASRVGEVIAFTTSRMSNEEHEALRILLTQAWFDLLEDKKLLADRVRSLLSAENYLSQLNRMGGLYRFSA